MTDLSSAAFDLAIWKQAQAVVSAALRVTSSPDTEAIAAAVLRAMAEQIAPEWRRAPSAFRAGANNERHSIYLRLLAIASELEREG